MYKLIRIVVCDMPGCETTPLPVQGEDDEAIKAGWVEGVFSGPSTGGHPRKVHVCPECVKGRTASEVMDYLRQSVS